MRRLRLLGRRLLRNPKMGRIVRNRAGSAKVEIVASVDHLESLTCDGSSVFWADLWSSGKGESGVVIRSASAGARDPIDLAFDPSHSVKAIAAAKGYVYWLAFQEGENYAVSRAPSR